VLRAALAPFGNADDFQRLARAARRYAAACVPDKGGRPPSAFDILCGRLKHGYEDATGRSASSTGDYHRLVEAVWPVAREVAEAVTKQPVPSNPSTSAALRRRLERLLPRL
jgi:hypothetical protein